MQKINGKLQLYRRYSVYRLLVILSSMKNCLPSSDVVIKQESFKTIWKKLSNIIAAMKFMDIMSFGE